MDDVLSRQSQKLLAHSTWRLLQPAFQYYSSMFMYVLTSNNQPQCHHMNIWKRIEGILAATPGCFLENEFSDYFMKPFTVDMSQTGEHSRPESIFQIFQI